MYAISPINWCSCALLKCLNFFLFPFFFFPLTKIESGLNSNLNKYTDLPNSLGSVNHTQSSSCSVFNQWNRMAVHTETDTEFYRELPADETPFDEFPTPHPNLHCYPSLQTVYLKKHSPSLPDWNLLIFLAIVFESVSYFCENKEICLLGEKIMLTFHLDECTSACRWIRTYLGPLPSHMLVLM